MIFFDPKENRHFVELNQDKKQIISWAEKGQIMHIRVMKMAQIRQFFDKLPTIFSKVIYDLEKDIGWIQYEGNSGVSCKELVEFINNHYSLDSDEHVIVFKRYARHTNNFSLPKEAALYQYGILTGIGLSKAIGNVKTGEIVNSEGNEADECVKSLREILM